MLNAEHRLRAADDFRITVRRGMRVGRPLVVVHALPPSADDAGEGAGTGSIVDPPRAGFVVSRSVGSAVVRNTVKRRLRHLMRDRMGVLARGARVVIRARPEAAHATSSALARDLDSALDRVDIRMAA